MSDGCDSPVVSMGKVSATAREVPLGATTSSARGAGLDLRSSASASAVELDNVLLGRSTKTTAIRHLVEILEAGVPQVEQRNEPMALITPTVVVMDRVVRGEKPRAPLKEVIEEYDSIVERLKRVVADPRTLRETEPGVIEALRGLCLAISRYASSLRKPPSTVPGSTRRS